MVPATGVGAPAHPVHPGDREKDMNMETMWPIKMLAKSFCMSESFWRKRIADGSIGAVRLGLRSIRVPDSEVKRFMTERESMTTRGVAEGQVVQCDGKVNCALMGARKEG